MNNTTAVIGYGNQGRSQALNLRDSGEEVIIGTINDQTRTRALEDGFMVFPTHEAVSRANTIFLLVPDDVLPSIFASDIKPFLEGSKTLVFASGYNIKYKKISIPKNTDIILIAPRMLGVGVREYYLDKKPFYCFTAIHQDVNGNAEKTLNVLVNKIGSDKAHDIRVSFETETELDLFTEQCFIPAIKMVMINAISILRDLGYDDDAILVELYKSGELSLAFQKAAEIGLFEQSKFHSNVSQYGSISRLNTFDNDFIGKVMRENFEKILNGDFDIEWTKESESGFPYFNELKKSPELLMIADMERKMKSSLACR